MSGVKYYLESPVTLRESGRIFDEDKLGMSNIAERFINGFLFLKKDENGFWDILRNTSGSIGIVSEVGTGKSFFLNVLYEKLQESQKKKREKVKNLYKILNNLCIKQNRLLFSGKIFNEEIREQLNKYQINCNNCDQCIETIKEEINYLEDELDNQKYLTVYIDIAKYQFEEDIFLPIYFEIVKQIKPNIFDFQNKKESLFFIYNTFKDVVNNINNDTLKKFVDTIDIIEVLGKNIINFKDGINNIYNYHFNDNREKLKEVHKKILSEDNSPQIFIIIDNLEKTKPEFIIDFLFKMREMFETFQNWLFILSYDKYEVQHALKAFYGENFNTQGFFRKFISTEFKIDRFYDIVDELTEIKLFKKYFNLKGYILGFDIQVSKLYKEINKQKISKEEINNEEESIGTKESEITFLVSLRLIKLLLLKLKNLAKIYVVQDMKLLFYIVSLITLKFVHETEYDKLFEIVLIDDDRLILKTLNEENCKKVFEMVFNLLYVQIEKDIEGFFQNDDKKDEIVIYLKKAFKQIELIKGFTK